MTVQYDSEQTRTKELTGIALGFRDRLESVLNPDTVTLDMTLNGNLNVQGVSGQTYGIWGIRGKGHKVTINGDMKVTGERAAGVVFWNQTCGGDIVINGDVEQEGSLSNYFAEISQDPNAGSKSVNITLNGKLDGPEPIRQSQWIDTKPLPDTTKEGYSTYGKGSVNVWVSESGAAPDSENAESNSIGTGSISKKANVRASASSKGKVLGTLQKGEVVKVLGFEGDYVKIDWKGAAGYVHKDYVKIP